MSKNIKYIDQFDKNAGAPEEFDSLFSFKNGELNVRRRIRMRKTGGRTAAMISAAAVITLFSVTGLALISTSGLSSHSGVAERDNVIDHMTEYYENDAAEETVYLSGIIDRFDYSLIDEMYQPDAEAEMVSAEADAYIFVNVALKYIDNGEIVYSVYLQSYYVNPEKMQSLNISGETVEIRQDFINGMQSELQIGSEYLIAVNIDDSVIRVDTTDEMTARKTDKGWLIYADSELAKYAVPVYNDIDDKEYALANDDTFYSDISDILGDEGRGLRYFTFGSGDQNDNGSISGAVPDDMKEYVTLPDGSSDSTLVKINPDENNEIKLHIDGIVSYSGKSSFGENMVVISFEEYTYNSDVLYNTAVISGLEGIAVSEGTIVTSDDIIGTASENGVYCRIYSNGIPINFLSE